MPRKASNNFKATNAKLLKELNDSFESDEFEKLLTTEQKMTGFSICDRNPEKEYYINHYYIRLDGNLW